MERTNRSRFPSLQTPSQRLANASKEPFKSSQLDQLEVHIPRSIAQQTAAVALRPLQTNWDARNANQSPNCLAKRPLKNIEPIDKMLDNLARERRMDPGAPAVPPQKPRKPGKLEYKLVDDKNVPEQMKDFKNKKKYKKLELLGHGGFGKVYHAQSMDTDAKHYAVKILSKESMKTEQNKRKLIAEINIHRVLKHDYIVKYYNCFEDKYNVYLLLELCENKTLSAMLKIRRRLSEIETRFFMGQILSALRYMSDNRILHRDLKLSNVLLDKNMDCKIGDFGLAALLLDNKERKRTVCGTPHYMAPEILFDKKNGHNYKADMWSAGVIMYNLLFGKHPFAGENSDDPFKQMKRNAYNAQVIFPSKNYDVSEDAKDLISKLLVKNPDERLTVIEALEHFFFSEHPMPDRIPVEALYRIPKHKELFGVVEINTQASESRVAAAVRLHKDRKESYVDNRVNPPLKIMDEVILDPRSQYPLESSEPLNPLAPLAPLAIPTQSISESNSKKRPPISNKDIEKGPKRMCSVNDVRVDRVEVVPVDKRASKEAQIPTVKEQTIVKEKPKEVDDIKLPDFEKLKVASSPSTDSRQFAIPFPLPNRKPIMVEMADNLRVMIDRVRAIPKEGRHLTIDEDLDFQWNDKNVFVSNWIDCTSHYGLSYRLSDGTMGLLFNDKSTVTTLNNKKYYYIYTRDEDNRYIEVTYERGKNLPQHLEKKCAIVDQFRDYIHQKLPLDRTVTQATEPTKIHIFKYIVADEGMAFRLNNGVIQFNFFKGSNKLILYDKGNRLIYIDKSRNIFRYNSLNVLASARQEIIDALYVAFGILDGQNKKRQDALSQMRWDRIGKQYDVERSSISPPVITATPPN